MWFQLKTVLVQLQVFMCIVQNKPTGTINLYDVILWLGWDANIFFHIFHSQKVACLCYVDSEVFYK